MLFSFTAFKNTLTSQITQCTAHVQTEDINYKDFIKQKTKKAIEKNVSDTLINPISLHISFIFLVFHKIISWEDENPEQNPI